DGTLYAAINVEIHAIGGGGLCEGKPVDCDDHDPCTVDRCDPQAGCVHAPKCVSPGPCTSAACGPDGTCSFAAAADGIACDDGIACSQGDACRSGQCVAPSSACALSGAWPATAHDGQHTNATSLLGPAAPTLKWASPVPGAGVFVIAGDGTIFASDGQRLQTIDNDGVAAPLATVPAIDLMLRQDGGLYATTAETTTMLQALGADGALQWTLDATPISAPVIGPSGAIYTETRRDLRAFAPDGSTAWAIPTGGGFAPPAVGLDGTVYAPAPDLWAIAADGRVKWKRPVGWARGLVVGPTGTTYAMLDGSVRATDANGADVWSFTGSSDAPLAPALSPGGDLILVVGSTFYRLDAASGRVRSTLTPPAPANTYQHLASPIIDGNDVLYVIANAEDSNSFQPQTRVTVYAVDRTDKVLWTAELAHAFGASGRALAIGPERTLYVTVSGSLYAIGP
ncbi:MAG TPA: PQQ-binding-like beta-propeller repeat protein, partial [Polyangia bacterium]|nr:PQQ-binding-like beta-propeller repeat protein [Polyangia bacterium]